MPIKYAVRTIHPLTPEQEAEKKRLSYLRKITYEEDVPHIVADMDEENGMYAIFSTNEVRLTDWLLLKTTDSLQKLLMLGRAKPGPILKDSIRQDIVQGDYVMTHNYDQSGLELSLVVRNLNVKVETQHLTNVRSWDDSLRKRNPEATLMIPKELIDGGTPIKEFWEKRFALREGADKATGRGVRYHAVVEGAARLDEESGCVGYFNSKGELVTGWVPYEASQWEEDYLKKPVYNRKKVVEVLDVPMTDALGTALTLGDFVFSNDNHYNTFMLCEVMGFTEEKVLLLGYNKHSNASSQGYRAISWNNPQKIIKLPITF